MAKLLIDHGADVHAETVDGAILVKAAGKGHKQIVELLLENGANIDHQNDHGETALYQAVRKANVSNSFDIEIIRILLENGAALDIADDQGKTPLDLVGPETDIGKMLLEAGAGD